MKKDFIPKTCSGKWSVGLTTFFLMVIFISIMFVKVFRILSFNDHWWDVTVPILALTTIVALILGVMAVIKKERSFLVYISITIGMLAVLFIPLHSLFIHD